MSDFAGALRAHIDYTAWASQRLLDAAAHLSEEELMRDFRTADHNVLGTLVHIFAADRVWLARLEGEPNPGFATEADRSLGVLQNDWPAVHERLRLWAERLDEQSILAPFTWTDMRGRTWTQPLWQVILHVVNHGTHHRGQVAGFLRAMGREPPPMDITVFDRKG